MPCTAPSLSFLRRLVGAPLSSQQTKLMRSTHMHFVPVRSCIWFYTIYKSPLGPLMAIPPYQGSLTLTTPLTTDSYALNFNFPICILSIPALILFLNIYFAKATPNMLDNLLPSNQTISSSTPSHVKSNDPALAAPAVSGLRACALLRRRIGRLHI